MATDNVYLNGRIVPAQQACLSVADVGFLYGGSVFTTLIATNGRAFRLGQHIRRLLDSAQMLDLRTTADPAALAQSVSELLAANGLDKARLRITLSPGDVHSHQPTVLISAEPMPTYPPEWITHGITVAVSPFKQGLGDPTYGFKTGCYFPRILARQEAHRKGAQEALWFTPDGRLAEGCFTNVFLVKDGALATPPRDTPAVPGITRQAVMELAEELKIACDSEKDLLIHNLLEADEVFLSATTTGITPVTRVERHAIGTEKPGTITQQLMAGYDALVEKETAAG